MFVFMFNISFNILIKALLKEIVGLLTPPGKDDTLLTERMFTVEPLRPEPDQDRLLKSNHSYVKIFVAWLNSYISSTVLNSMASSF